MQGLTREWSNAGEATAGEPDDTDAALATRARTDRAAFGVLYDRYVGRVFAYCYRRLGNRQAAEDATSVVFVKALAAMSNYRDNGPSFRSWLFAVAHNVLADIGRAYQPDRPLDEASSLAASTPGPEEDALAEERGRELRALLMRLPADQRELVELRLAGLNDAEIARVVGRSHGAVRVAQHRAVRRLRDLMGITTQENHDV